MLPTQNKGIYPHSQDPPASLCTTNMLPWVFITTLIKIIGGDGAVVESSSTVVATERQAVFRLPAGWGKVWTAEDRAKVHLLTDTPPGTNNKQMAGQMWAGGDLGHRAKVNATRHLSSRRVSVHQAPDAQTWRHGGRIHFLFF